MTRFKAIIEYDGTNYGGFQIQENALTIQAVLEKALGGLYGADIKIAGSGRTDAGVHAVGQVIHFDAKNNIPADKVPLALVKYLPRDISMRECAEVGTDFHARFSAVSKTYVYRVVCSKVNRPLSKHCYIYPYTLNIDKMKRAAELIRGQHNFKGFMASGSSVVNTVRTVTDLSIKARGEELTFTVSANGFLYNMVRNIVGILLDIGRGFRNIEDLQALLDSGDKRYAGHTAPAVGLCLERVEY